MIQPSGSAIQYIVLPGLLMTMGIGFSIVPSTIAATQSATPGRRPASPRGSSTPHARSAAASGSRS